MAAKQRLEFLKCISLGRGPAELKQRSEEGLVLSWCWWEVLKGGAWTWDSSQQVRASPAPLPGDPCSVGWLLLQADQVRLKGSDQKCRYVWGRDQQASVECATQAWEKYNSEKDIVAHIKKEFDKKYNPTWHCIVGRNLSSSRTKENKHFIHSFGPSGHSSAQIWLKAWTLPYIQWSIQRQDHSPHSKHQRLQSSAGAYSNTSWNLIVFFCACK